MTPFHVEQREIHYYMDLIDVVRDGIICTDHQGSIVFVNQTARAMLGYHPEELLGVSFEVIFLEDDRLRTYPRVFLETLDRGSYRGEFLFVRKDGSRFLGELSSSWLKEGEEDKDLVFVIHDISEQKRLQQQLTDSQNMAYLGKVVEGISHEIRNPIVTLGGYARRLKASIEPNHPGQDYLQIILENVQRMEGMLREINDYIDFAQIDRPSFRKLDLQAVLRDALQAMQWPTHVRLEAVYPTQGPWIYGNYDHLRELFSHILENALEAMPDSGSLQVRLQQDDSHAKVEIQDSGVGIAEDDLPHIFNPFFSTKTKSTGVGLARARIIVEGHSGEILIESRVQEGTTFTVLFPLDRRQWVRRDERA